MNKSDIIVAQMQKDIEYIKEYLIGNKEDHERLEKKIDNLDKRYAPKSTEKLMYIFITAMTSAVAYLIFIKP